MELLEAIRSNLLSPGAPVEVTDADDGIAIGREAAFPEGAVAGILIVDGGFVDLELVGLVDGIWMAGSGVDTDVECLPPDVDVVSSSEALGNSAKAYQKIFET